MHPNTGKIHRESKRGTQHYLVCSWRGIQYTLTGRFAYYGPNIVAEYSGADGKQWSDEDGNWYKGPPPAQNIWTEEIKWERPKTLDKVTSADIEDTAKEIAATNGLDWDKMSDEDKHHARTEASHSFDWRV